MDRRSFLATSGGAAVVSTGILFGTRGLAQATDKHLAAPLPVAGAPHPSPVLAAATLSSAADTYTLIHKGGSNPSASATATYRLAMAFLADQEESGQAAIDQALILNHPDKVLGYTLTPADRAVYAAKLKSLGLSDAPVLPTSTSPLSERQDAIDKIRSVGLTTYYVTELNKVIASLPKGVTVAGYHNSRTEPHLEEVLDRLSCQIFGVAGAIAGATGNVVGALIFGIIVACCC